MSPARKQQNHRLLAALLRTRSKRLAAAAATIAVTITLTAQTGAQAMEQARQTVLYVGVPAVSDPTAREAGVASREVAPGASPQTLVALGFTPRATRRYALQRALASVAEAPGRDAAQPITAQAALEAGNTYLAQSGRQLQEASSRQDASSGRGELANAGPMRPQLGDGTVAPPQAIGAPPEKSDHTPGPAPEIASSPDAAPSSPSPSSGGQDLAGPVQPAPGDAASADDSNGRQETPAPDTSARGDGSRPDSSENSDHSSRLLSQPTGDTGKSNGPSMTGPIASEEQVPTDLSGGKKMAASDPKGTSTDHPTPSESPAPRTDGGQHLAAAPAPPKPSTTTDGGSTGGSPTTEAARDTGADGQSPATPPAAETTTSPSQNTGTPVAGNDGQDFAVVPAPPPSTTSTDGAPATDSSSSTGAPRSPAVYDQPTAEPAASSTPEAPTQESSTPPPSGGQPGGDHYANRQPDNPGAGQNDSGDGQQVAVLPPPSTTGSIQAPEANVPAPPDDQAGNDGSPTKNGHQHQATADLAGGDHNDAANHQVQSSPTNQNSDTTGGGESHPTAAEPPQGTGPATDPNAPTPTGPGSAQDDVHTSPAGTTSAADSTLPSGPGSTPATPSAPHSPESDTQQSPTGDATNAGHEHAANGSGPVSTDVAPIPGAADQKPTADHHTGQPSRHHPRPAHDRPRKHICRPPAGASPR